MTNFAVFSHNVEIKRFPHYEQCLVWCVENKLAISYGRVKIRLINDIKIKEVK